MRTHNNVIWTEGIASMLDELHEPVAIVDVYVDQPEKVEILGNNVCRVTYTARLDGQKIVALRMIRRMDSIKGTLRHLITEALIRAQTPPKDAGLHLQ